MLKPWEQIRLWKTKPFSLSQRATSWVMGKLLSIHYWKTKSQIDYEFKKRELKLYDIAHVSFYISTRPVWK